METFKLLLDTNVVIGLEDPKPVQSSLAELARLCNEHGVAIFVDGASYEDVSRDPDDARRTVTLSKLAKFQRLSSVPARAEAELVDRFGSISGPNDRSDVRLLSALDANAADFLITEDAALRRRSVRSGYGPRVLSVAEAVAWLRQTFVKSAVQLPYISSKKAYELDLNHPIFQSLAADYKNFNVWFQKCQRQHRECWVLEIGDDIAGLVIRKDESHYEAQTKTKASKILKICTFKVGDEFRGEKLGELLLKQALWFAQRNSYELIYLTAYPKHEELIELLLQFGFVHTRTFISGEKMYEKAILIGPTPSITDDPLAFDRTFYPRFFEQYPVKKFIVPIRPEYHRLLFPEIALLRDLPLFPGEMGSPFLSSVRTPGNTIKKVYLCRAKTSRLAPGDLLIFYMSKHDGYAFSQCATTIGIVEQFQAATSSDELVKLTAKRSVFSAQELHAFEASPQSPVQVIDFLLAGHLQPAISLQDMISLDVLRAPPQSIVKLDHDEYERLRQEMVVS